MCLVGISNEATDEDSKWLSSKLLNFRLFDSDDGKRWAKGVKGIEGEVLLVSQFTLYATIKGNKPDYHKASECLSPACQTPCLH